MLFSHKFRFVSVEFCCNAAARAWQETNHLRNTMMKTAHIPQSCESLPIVLPISEFKVLGSKTKVHGSSLIRCTADLMQILHNFWLIAKLLSLKCAQKMIYICIILKYIEYNHPTFFEFWITNVAHLRTNFPDLTFKQLCLDPSLACLHILSPHDTIFTKHQALAPSSPMLLACKCRSVRLEFCFKASARAWQETNDLRNTMKHTAHTVKNCKKYAKFACSSSHSHLKMLVPGSKNETIKSPWVIKGTLHCQFATLCTFNEPLVWGILELAFWTHQQIVANIWLFLWPGHPMVLPQANISLGALEKKCQTGTSKSNRTLGKHGGYAWAHVCEIWRASRTDIAQSPTTATDQYPMDRVPPQSLILNLQWLFWPYFFYCKYSILMIFGILNQLSSQTSMIFLAHLSTNTALHCLSSFPWPHFQTAVPWPFPCLSSHPLPSKHQALAPSSPMLLACKCRSVRLEFCFKASARAWQETNDLRNTMKHTAHTVKNCKKYAKFACSSSHSHLKMLVPGSKNETIKSPWVIKGTLHCQFATLCTFKKALVWGILELEFWTHQQIVANIWPFLWPGHPMVLPQANISLGALEKMPNRNLKIEQNSWKTRGLCMGTCLWNLNSKS